ncbi:MAG TPA: glycosyltransferase family 39 protein [Acidobacteriaceae bacterium]|jgi:hypothetical protein|nr:glycosyltransferase family 39 protein [Acidobacteriaceae bacterium]
MRVTDLMQVARKFRLPALLCALAVLVCELVSWPYTTMGVCDDMSYILIARKVAETGHIFYNGPTTPMLGWQLYLGALFIKLFGYSLTTVRMSTLLVSMVLAFVLQRALVRANISERNATLGTMALVLSPLYLVLSVTFMSDIQGLFAIVLCLYGCLRAVQADMGRAAIAWVCFAVAADGICGTSRQIAWLGILVMVPSTVWLLRSRRDVFIGAAAANVAGVIWVFGCLQWFKHQPYNVPEHVFSDSFNASHAAGQLGHIFLDAPFLLLPIVALFLPGLQKNRRWVLAVGAVLAAGYLFLATYPSHVRGSFPLDPTGGDWVDIYGVYGFMILKGNPPIFLNRAVQVVMTIVSVGGVLGLISLLCHRVSVQEKSAGVSWKQLGVLLGPFGLVYVLLLIPRAGDFHLTERYLLELLVAALVCMVRYYQDAIRPELPWVCAALVALMAMYGVVNTHNTFAVDRGRVVLANELLAAGVPDTAVDNGWEYNQGVELEHAGFINDYRMINPKGLYREAPPLPEGTCEVNGHDLTPHIQPRYGISFDPDACYGQAPFAPVHYSRWLGSEAGTLYVVYYTKP